MSLAGAAVAVKATEARRAVRAVKCILAIGELEPDSIVD
jgi:hypothetical protein